MQNGKIALINASFGIDYQSAIMRGIAEACEQAGFVLHGIQSGGLSGNKDSVFSENSMFTLPMYGDYAGAIVLTAGIVGNNDVTDLQPFLPRLAHLPLVAVGPALADCSSIDTDPLESMRQLMGHLLDHHGYRSFLFLGGPPLNRDNQVRQAVFQTEIEKRQDAGVAIQFSIHHGHFLEENGFKLVQELYLSGAGLPRVIVAANDAMAIGVIKALRLLKIDCPSQVAVTGFDAVQESEDEVPALTTIRQPFREMGRHAVNLLLSNKIPVAELFETELIIRESCGCHQQPPKPRTSLHAFRQQRVDLNVLDNLRRRSVAFERAQKQLAQFSNELMQALSMSDVLTVLRRQLPGLKHDWFSLVVWETPPLDRTVVPSHGRILYQSDGTTEKNCLSLGCPILIKDFLNTEICPAGVARNMIFRGLFSGYDQLGFVAFSVPESLIMSFNYLSILLSHSIRTCKQHEEQRNVARELELAVQERTRDLRRTNTLLQEEVARRIAAQHELDAERQNLAHLLDAMPVPVIVHQRLNRTILYANRAFRDLATFGAETNNVSLSSFLQENNPQNGNEYLLNVQLPGGGTVAIPVLIQSAELRFNDVDCVVSGFLDLRDRRALEQEVLSVSESERQRFGQDLHDDICQRLAGVVIFADLLAKRLSTISQAETGQAKALAALIDETLRRTRIYARGLFPVELDSVGIVGALQALCDTVAAQTERNCRCFAIHSAVEGLFSAEQEIHLYRIAQEAIRNAITHGKARDIEVSLNATSNSFNMKISDNGCGIVPLHEGMGIRTMRYRAGQLGARFDIQARVSGGLQICITRETDTTG